MSKSRHERASELFMEVRDLGPDERSEFLDRACAGDAGLRAEVESLLAHDADAFPPLEAEVAAAAVDLLPPSVGPAASVSPDQFDSTFIEQPQRTPVIPGYEVLRLLGSGGMGSVYLCEDTTLRRKVAIKVTSDTRSGDRAAQRRFRREARTLAALEHPNIVRVHSFGQNEGRFYLVMEYVDGQGLNALIEQRGRLDANRALRILRQTVEALEAGWEHGIVHRDIKPANILIDLHDRVRVVDFGIAKAVGIEFDTSITDSGQVMGTPCYIAPEQARGESTLDFRTDVYSLGIVLFEMLAGRPPFDGASAIAVVEHHLHTPLPSLQEHCPDVASEVRQLCDWMARKHPDDRPSSYRELQQVLDVLVGDAAAPVAENESKLPPFVTAERKPQTPDFKDRVFVAREVELAGLASCLEKAIAGRGQVVFATGEAGCGKSALLMEFARRAQETHRKLIVACGNCADPSGIGDPYMPFREILSLLTGDVETKKASGAIRLEHARRLWNLLPAAARALVEEGPDLVGTLVPAATLLSRASSHTPSPIGWRARLEELAGQRAAASENLALRQSDLFEQYSRVLLTLARNRPILLELEDLHWVDAGSAGLLFHLARRIANSPILIVGTYRPGEVAADRGGGRHPLNPVLNELTRLFGDVGVHLRQEGSQEFVDALVDSRPNQLGPDFRRSVYLQTQGNPLFTVELLSNMQGRGMLVQDDQGRWIEGAALDWDQLPARCEGIIRERVERLSDGVRRALTIASVQGAAFNAEVIARIQDVDLGKIMDLLNGELGEKHRLVTARGLRRIEGRRISRYRFRHVLFQKYLYERLDAVQRAFLHEDVATSLEALYGDNTEEIAGELARHFQEASVPVKAIEYLRQAGQHAVRLVAYQDAIVHFTQGLRLAETLPDKGERDRSELALQLALGPPLMATAGPASKRLDRAYTRAHELCRDVGDAEQQFQTLFVLNAHYGNRGKLGTALELAEQMLSVAQDGASGLPVLPAHYARGLALFFMGRLAEARDAFQCVDAHYDSGQHRSLIVAYGNDPGSASTNLNSVLLWYLGYPDQARDAARRALELAHGLDHPVSLAHALLFAANVALYRGEIPVLEERTEELVRLAGEKGNALFHAWGSVFRGYCHRERGRAEEAISWMRQGLSEIQATGAELAVSHLLAILAQACGEAGRIEEALETVAEGLAKTREGDRLFEAELYRIKGALLLQQAAGGAEPTVESCFRQALDVAREQGARSWELRAATDLARSWAGRGKPKQARELLGPIYGWFSEGLDTPDLVQAKALLADL